MSELLKDAGSNWTSDEKRLVGDSRSTFMLKRGNNRNATLWQVWKHRAAEPQRIGVPWLVRDAVVVNGELFVLSEDWQIHRWKNGQFEGNNFDVVDDSASVRKRLVSSGGKLLQLKMENGKYSQMFELDGRGWREIFDAGENWTQEEKDIVSTSDGHIFMLKNRRQIWQVAPNLELVYGSQFDIQLVAGGNRLFMFENWRPLPCDSNHPLRYAPAD